MELLRQDTDYAVRAMVHLTQSEAQERVSAGDLASAQDIPLSFCHKILRKLVQAGLVRSRPGRNGGFHLARPAATIALFDIVEAIQGPVAVSQCMLSVRACPRRARCPASRKWQGLQDRIVSFLKTTKLDDIVKG